MIYDLQCTDDRSLCMNTKSKRDFELLRTERVDLSTKLCMWDINDILKVNELYGE